MSSANVFALIPARSGSRGIVGKNFKPIAGGLSCADRALLCARHAGVPASRIILSTDADYPEEPPHAEIAFRLLKRPAALAQDTTPMIDVVQHALEQIPGPPEQIIVLLQPTQVLRTPAHVQAAIALLRETQADSVVSVVALPLTHHPSMQCTIESGQLWAYANYNMAKMPPFRQLCGPTYVRDGTVYAFWRKTFHHHETIYGQDVRPLIIPAEETCPLDPPADWVEAERRLREREG